MAKVADLIPELKRWNEGTGISPEDWIYIEGRADHALGFCALFWPDFVQIDDYVLRAPLDVDRLRGWESTGHSKQQVEAAMNAFLFDYMFPDDVAPVELKSAQLNRLATIMSNMLVAKLKSEFPDRNFCAFVLEGADFGLSFYQV
ncbi:MULTISPECIES: hypothetical protein [unclassified Sphingomonas]|uniref:hypothetical protein n=1 Tax=unclassified Sphingomonas TaxID=196159 RepID=UPI002859A683|nr:MULTISPECIES: hypothetical protein [unclassified Sphingomonas]MDR6113996.1 hypothetical protein [Sphingomonas sp. SORGH_AS_0789]MDR6148644.1 hypothetical protein [Sphingomonas sp. SORGH_AS_0742]